MMRWCAGERQRQHRKAVVAVMAALATVGCAESAPESTQQVAPLVQPLPPGAYREPAGQPPHKQALEVATARSLAPQGWVSLDSVAPEITQRGTLLIGVDQSQNLTAYRDAVTGELTGFEVELGREIARDLLGDPDKAEFRFLDSSDRIPALQNSSVDMVIRSMSVSTLRQQQVNFSIPYLHTSMRILTLRNSPITDFSSLPGRTVCAVEGSMSVDTARTYAPQSPVLITRSWSDCLLALQQHQTEAIITDDIILTGFAAQDPTTHIVGTSVASSDWAIATAHNTDRANGDDLIRQINASLERIRRDGTWWRLYNKWFSAYLPTSGPPAYQYRS